jgi:hypothetical protein
MGPHLEAQAARRQRLLQHLARGVVELPLHQRVHHVHHRDLHATQHQAVGGFQAQQAATDDDGVLVRLGRVDHRLRVGDVAVGDHTGQVLAGHGQDERVGTRGDQQAVVGRFGAVFGHHTPLDAVDGGHRLAQVQRDALLGIPGQRIQDDLLDRLFARQHRAQQDAVVVGVGLGTEDGDVVQIGRDLQQLFERAHTGHAVADHHELEFFHWALRLGLKANVEP